MKNKKQILRLGRALKLTRGARPGTKTEHLLNPRPWDGKTEV